MLLLCRLTFGGPLRLSTGGSAELSSAGWQVRSDSLSAALCSAWIEFYGRESLDPSRPPFLVSSAFPWAGREPELFWPIPCGRQPECDKAERKLWKRVFFASTELWSRMLQSERALPASGLHLRLGGLTVSDKAGAADEWFFKSYSVPHVTLDRISSASQVFSQEEVCFADRTGLFFVAHVEDAAVARFGAVLRVLGEQGLGADRSAGRGAFTVEIDDRWHLPASKGPARMLLSLCWPRRDEVEGGLLAEGRYGLVQRGGWVTAPGARTAQRPTINMLIEGSVIHASASASSQASTHPSSEGLGQVSRVLKTGVAPGLDHDIFRDGRGFAVPCC